MILPPVESAQVVYHRLRERLASVQWVELEDGSVRETNDWTEYRVERPNRVALVHHTAYSFYRTDGRRTTASGMINRNARPNDRNVTVPGWESLLGQRLAVEGDARKVDGGTEIDFQEGGRKGTLRIDAKSGVASLYRWQSGRDESWEYRYTAVKLHNRPPAEPIHVAEPQTADRITASLTKWLRRRSFLRLTLIHDTVQIKDAEIVEYTKPSQKMRASTAMGQRPPTLHWSSDPRRAIPGFEAFFGFSRKGQSVGIRPFDDSREGYVVRTYEEKGWTDVFYSTDPDAVYILTGGRFFVHLPIGYERYAQGKRREKVRIDVAVDDMFSPIDH